MTQLKDSIKKVQVNYIYPKNRYQRLEPLVYIEKELARNIGSYLYENNLITFDSNTDENGNTNLKALCYVIDTKNTKEITPTQLLDNAIDYIYNLLKHSGYDICEFLHDIPEENTICANTCENMKKECILRFLKHYKIGYRMSKKKGGEE